MASAKGGLLASAAPTAAAVLAVAMLLLLGTTCCEGASLAKCNSTQLAVRRVLAFSSLRILCSSCGVLLFSRTTWPDTLELRACVVPCCTNVEAGRPWPASAARNSGETCVFFYTTLRILWIVLCSCGVAPSLLLALRSKSASTTAAAHTLR